MRYFFLISSLALILTGFSQNYFFGDNQSSYKLDKHQYFFENQHTVSKPYLINKPLDTLRQSGKWKYSSDRNSSKLKVLPLFGSQLKFDLEDKYFSQSMSLGIQLNSSINDRFSSQFRFGLQNGKLSNYESNALFKRPLAPGVGYLNDSVRKTFLKPIIEGVLAYQPNKWFVFSGGIGKQFFGDGYRSLWLSDYAPAFPFIKMESTFWKAKYINLWSLHDDLHTQLFSRYKWSSSHMLSLNILKWLNLSVFESIVWQGQDTLSKRGFDINYVNPFVFYRPVEYGIGSSDNSFLGGGVKVSLKKKYVIYSNFILDEFLLSEFKSKSGWWGNKFGYQFGIKVFDILNIDGLYGLSEFNSVRPYTYSHMTSMQNYGHQNHSLAHPLEANFSEFLFMLGYQRENIDFLFQYHFQRFGKDFNQENYGGNMFNSYNDRYDNNVVYGHVIGQGHLIEQQVFSARISILLMPLTNTKLFTQINVRSQSQLKSTMFNFGVSSNLWQSYLDY